MSNKYTENLIQRTIKYFKMKYNHDISPEIAEEYLNSLAILYRSITNLTKSK